MYIAEQQPQPALPDPLTEEGAAVLHQLAERHYRRWRCSMDGYKPVADADQEQLLEDLRIHELELQIQNESLRTMRLKLEQSLSRYEALFDFAPVALLTLSEDGTIHEINDTASVLLDLPASALIGKRFGLFISADHRQAFNDLVRRVQLDSGQPYAELVVEPDDKPPCWVLAKGRLVGEPRCAVQLALTDISDRKRAEQVLQSRNASLEQHVSVRTAALQAEIERCRSMEMEIRALNQDLEARVAARTAEATAANAAKDVFLAHMSHEIRTPLNAIIGLAQLLASEPLEARLQHQVHRIQEASESLLAIVNDILDLSKMGSGKLAIASLPFNLSELIERLNSWLGSMASAKGLSFQVECSLLPTTVLQGDPIRLQQVLSNLIGNSIKFTERGGVTLRIEAQGQPVEETLRLRFSVEDTGIGIEPARLGSLFQPFTQGDPNITRHYGGTGLGLAICKRLVELMGGEIGAASEPGRGSQFWFELSFPCVDEGLVSLPIRPPPMLPHGRRLAGWRLLLVDDSEINLEVVREVLEREGALVTTATDGAQALTRLEAAAEPYHAVLMDVQMPVMDGLAATRRIRNELGLRSLPVIGLTAAVLAHECEAAREAGMTDVLPKPIRIDEMVSCIRRWADPDPSSMPRADATQAPAAERVAAEGPACAAGLASDGKAPPQAPPGAGPSRAAYSGGLAVGTSQRLFARFVAENAELVTQLRQDLACGRHQAVARRLHQFKGAAAILSIQPAMELAKALETEIARDKEGAEQSFAQLEHYLQELRTSTSARNQQHAQD